MRCPSGEKWIFLFRRLNCAAMLFKGVRTTEPPFCLGHRTAVRFVSYEEKMLSFETRHLRKDYRNCSSLVSNGFISISLFCPISLFPGTPATTLYLKTSGGACGRCLAADRRWELVQLARRSLDRTKLGN